MMDTFIELTATIMQNFLIIWFISGYCGYKYNGIKRYIRFGIILIADCIFVSIINRFISYDGVLAAVSILMYIIYCHTCLKKNEYFHIFISCFAMVVIFTLSSVISFLISNLTNNPVSELYDSISIWRIIILIICRLSEFAVFKFILYLNKAYNLSKKEWLLFAFTMLVTWLEIVLFNKAAIQFKDIKLYMLYASLLALVINVLSYYFIMRINKETKLNTELTLLKMQYENVKETEENLAALYESAYSLKHDLEKHFIAIRTTAEQNNDKSIIEYVDSIINKYYTYTHKTVFTNNKIFNAVINTRLEICQHKKIKTTIKVENDILNNINDEDIAVLFGNIFDNAIEAAEKVEDKFVSLEIQKQGAYISIYMENSFDGLFDPELKSRKGEKHEHGIGMKNVRRIVEEYNGMMKCFVEENIFCCDILLKAC